MSQWNDDKAKAKDIFDSIRNFALCGVVFYVAMHYFSKPMTVHFMIYVNYLTGGLMLALSIYLFTLNIKSFNSIVRREHKSGNVGSLFYYVIPALVFMLGINLFVQTAFSIQVGNGKTVGELTIQDLQVPIESKANEEP